MSKDPVSTVQLIAAPGVRAAQRDYLEMPPASIRVLLATSTEEELQEDAATNPYLFKHRFGVQLPRKARDEIIALVDRLQLTDEEVRWMRRGGALRLEGGKVRPESGHWGLAIGMFYLLAMTSFCGSYLLAIGLSTPSGPAAGLVSANLAALLVATGWLCSKLFFTPWRVCRRALTVG
jgi:hypothetical protein